MAAGGPSATRIILVSAFADFSLGIAALVSGLERLSSRGVGLRWIVRDYARVGTVVTSRFVKDLLLFEPDVIALSCFFWNLDDALRMARLARHLRPGILTVLGGPQVGDPSEAARLMEEQDCVDVALCGEADLTFPELIERHREHRDLASIPGVVYRQGRSVQVATGGRSLAKLSELPPVLHQGNPYVRARATRSGMLSLETLRGCRRSCAYCLYCSGSLRYYPLERVEQEMEFVLARGVRHLRICDSHLGGTRGRAMEILSLMAHYNRETTVTVYPDPQHVDDEYAELLGRAGCRVLSLGVETLDPEVSARMGRPADTDGIARAVSILRRHGQSVQGDIMFGLPGQTSGSLARDIEALKRMGAHRVLLSPLMVFPGTRLAREAAVHGVGILPCAQGYGYDMAAGIEGLAAQLRVVEASRLRSLLPETLSLLRGRNASPEHPAEVTAALECLEWSSVGLREGIETVTAACLSALGATDLPDVRESARLDILTLAMHRIGAEVASAPEGPARRTHVFFQSDLASRRWTLAADVWLGTFRRMGNDEHYLFNGPVGVRERLGDAEARGLSELASSPGPLDSSRLPRPERWVRSGALAPADGEAQAPRPTIAGDYDCYALASLDGEQAGP